MHVGKCALVVTIGLALSACDEKKAEPAPAPSASATTAAMPSTSVAAPSDSAPAASATTASGNAPLEIAAQHILVAYKGAKGAQGSIVRSKADAKKRADEIDAKAKAPNADFSALAQQYSDDLGSRDRQGNLGKFARGKMVPQFSDAAFALAVDQVSDVVETPFGFHIIKRNQ